VSGFSPSTLLGTALSSVEGQPDFSAVRLSASAR
jgi:hypothetical protein